MRALIYGLAKSGSSALAYHLKASLPDHALIFEPARLSSTPPGPNLIVKSFWKEADTAEGVLSSFNKRILLLRHPLDRLLSVVIYKMSTTTRVVSDPFARAVIEAFEAIETGKIGFRELYVTMWRLFEQSDIELSRIAGINRSWLERGPGFFMPFPYEDMIAGRYDALASYLGTSIVEGGLPPTHQHVARSKSEGGWKRWMTAEDVGYFAAMPEIAEYARLFSYDLTLPADAVLDRRRPEGSSYVRMQIDRVRRRWGAPPFSTGSANGRPNSHFLSAANALDQGDFDRAFDASLNALLSGSPEVLNYVVTARGFSQQGRHSAAAAAARRATELAPWLVQGWGLLAAALQQLGLWDEAAAAADEVIRGEPGLAENHMLRATIMTEARNWAQAEISIRRALACPNAPKRLHKNLASALWELGRADEGLTELEIAIRHDPAVWHNYALKVHLCLDLGRLEEADAALAAARANPAALATTVTALTDRLRRAREASSASVKPA